MCKTRRDGRLNHATPNCSCTCNLRSKSRMSWVSSTGTHHSLRTSHPTQHCCPQWPKAQGTGRKTAANTPTPRDKRRQSGGRVNARPPDTFKFVGANNNQTGNPCTICQAPMATTARNPSQKRTDNSEMPTAGDVNCGMGEPW
jgi:hypothetical protein